jgi:hypothetical protein
LGQTMPVPCAETSGDRNDVGGVEGALGQQEGNAPRSACDYVGSLIAAFITQFGLRDSRSLILQTYEELCGESLAFPLGTRFPGYSGLNADGTPFQFAITIRSSQHTLQFIGEPSGAGLSGAERMRVSRERITALAHLLGTEGALASISPLLDTLAPETDRDLLSDPGGAYWAGAAFASHTDTSLRIYVNARWGKESKRWNRLDRFAAHWQCDCWHEIAAGPVREMEPLGMAITLSNIRPPTGRIYLSAYGKRMVYYEQLADGIGGEDLTCVVRRFGGCMLGDGYGFPTPTAVCSFGLGESPVPDFKFELCAHCLFTSDVEAAGRLRSWFKVVNQDAADYWSVLDILSAGHLSQKTIDLHCYVGVGLRKAVPSTTIYLKPWLKAP